MTAAAKDVTSPAVNTAEKAGVPARDVTRPGKDVTSPADIRPSKLYFCPVCPAKWYGANLHADGTIPGHTNRHGDAPSPGRLCDGTGRPAATAGRVAGAKVLVE